MGKQAHSFFEEADRLGGLVARMRLASLAQVTSTEAAAADDGSEVAERLKRAMPVLTREFGSPSRHDSGHAPSSSGPSPGTLGILPPIHPNPLPTIGHIGPGPRGEEGIQFLRGQLSSIADLMAQRDLVLETLETTFRRITEAASSVMRVRRVSVWFLNETQDRIVCKNLFDMLNAEHSSGTELFAKDFQPYFDALRRERTIAANDAHSDPRTACFSASYLAPLGINSMLDVPIWSSGAMIGVICCEHVGPARTWNSDEERFAYVLSNLVAISLERAGTKTSR
ncbi:MAG TPA: GAF domain-containing protein [Polyangiaceae bacterium]|nr:GAF domain-containing protein [Polyangiaceae bacterium]